MQDETIMKYFEHSHLPEHLRLVSKLVCETAKQMCEILEPSAEKQPD